MTQKELSKKFEELKEENKELKEALTILSNEKIIKKLNDALDDIKHGRYTSS